MFVFVIENFLYVTFPIDFSFGRFFIIGDSIIGSGGFLEREYSLVCGRFTFERVAGTACLAAL